MILSVSDLFDLAHRHGAQSGVAHCVVAGALVESGGNTDAVGDNGHSVGLWQMHDQGLGSGLSYEQRSDPDQAASVMVPVFQNYYLKGQQSGYTGETLARYTIMYTERPRGFPDLYSNAANAYITRWASLPDSPAPITPADDELALEREWGTALLIELDKWATLLQDQLNAMQEVINTMRQNAGTSE